MGLPFIFILSLIIAALIIIFAVMSIQKVKCNSELVEINTFVRDLQNEVEKTFYATAGNVGTQVTFTAMLPTKGCSEIKFVCFAFPNNPKTEQVQEDIWFEITRYRGQNKQLFFYPAEGLQKVGASQAFTVKFLNITKNPQCYRNEGKFEFLLMNKGKYVLIE